jgi:hypothetical protein
MFPRPEWTRRGLVVVLATAIVTALIPAGADAIPAFARRYSQSCTLCHTAAPKLNATGEMFAGHGFRMAPGEQILDAVEQDDSLLTLPKTLPLAIRVDGRFAVETDEDGARSDFQSPWVLKILSSAPLSNSLSYYFYFMMDERGDVVGLEDAFLYWNDVGGRPLDIAFGQFQVSDPLFKRELRLPVEDYVIYKARVGEQPANLAYDRGLMAITEPLGFTMTLEVVNGNGVAAGEPWLDDDSRKNVFGHLTRDLLPSLRFGVLGYWGSQSDDASVRNELWMAGGDATVVMGPLELNLQYVHREDDRPTFTPGEARTETDGGFAELLVVPPDSRWYGYALYNRVENDRSLLDPGGGWPSEVEEYETAAAGAGYVLRRNVRLYGEALYDLEAEAGHFTLGAMLAY